MSEKIKRYNSIIVKAPDGIMPSEPMCKTEDVEKLEAEIEKLRSGCHGKLVIRHAELVREVTTLDIMNDELRAKITQLKAQIEKLKAENEQLTKNGAALSAKCCIEKSGSGVVLGERELECVKDKQIARLKAERDAILVKRGGEHSIEDISLWLSQIRCDWMHISEKSTKRKIIEQVQKYEDIHKVNVERLKIAREVNEDIISERDKYRIENAKLKTEWDALQTAINNFCERTKHSDPFWLKQDYIKGLFDLWHREQGDD